MRAPPAAPYIEHGVLCPGIDDHSSIWRAMFDNRRRSGFSGVPLPGWCPRHDDLGVSRPRAAAIGSARLCYSVRPRRFADGGKRHDLLFRALRASTPRTGRAGDDGAKLSGIPARPPIGSDAVRCCCVDPLGLGLQRFPRFRVAPAPCIGRAAKGGSQLPPA